MRTRILTVDDSPSLRDMRADDVAVEFDIEFDIDPVKEAAFLDAIAQIILGARLSTAE